MKNKINKQALREKIQSLEGLSNEDKSQLLALLAEQKKYGLVWEDSPEEAEEVLREKIPVLREVAEKRLDKGGDDAPNHILIEGDNLHALTALTYTHEDKVDVIYIDPPYNTGNKDFVYNDSFVDSEDSYRHSKWLSFMERRLRIAKKLLSDKGVIFISIDDNEQANLKLLCDEVFGEKNFQANISRIATKRIKGDVKNINILHDYILMYSYNENFKVIHKLKEDYSIYELSDEYENERGKHLLRPLDNRNINYSSKSDYKIVAPDGSLIVAGGNLEEYNKRISGSHGTKDWCFRWNKDKYEWGIDNGFIVFKKNKDGIWRCYFKIYQFVDNNLNPTQKFDSYTSIIDECFNNQGTTEIKNILGNNVFTYPKPLSLLTSLLSMVKEDSLILDFFAGSGTTLHATMQLNAEDGGHRQCILVTNNENNICEEVTYERNKRVINGYTTPKGVEVEGLKANNLRYYKTDFVSRDGSHQSKKEIAYAMTDLLCIKEGIYDEQDAFGNLSLTGKSKMLRYFAEEGKQMLLIYDSVVIPYIVKEIEQMDKPEKDIKIYIFADGSYPYTADFDNVLDKVTLIAMPYAMDRALKLVLPERDDIELEVEPETVEDNA